MKVKQRRLSSWRGLFRMPLVLPALLPLVLAASLLLPGTVQAQIGHTLTVVSSDESWKDRLYVAGVH